MTTGARPWAQALPRWLMLWVFAALPLAGLANGALYAPLLFGMAVVLAAARLAAGGGWPVLDARLGLLLGIFLVLGWASVGWSVAPAESLRRAVQVSFIAAATLLLLAQPQARGEDAARIFMAMLATLALGALLMVADRASGYRVQHLLAAHAAFPSAKYNRGLDYLAVLMWPLLAGLTQTVRPRTCALAAALAALLLLAGLSTTAKVALLAGAAALGAARLAPRWTARALAGLMAVMAITLPLSLRIAAQHRGQLAHLIKPSGVHRLEIWDYMTARVAERPLQGWGLAAAQAVPIHQAELAHYHFVQPQGVYPHQQWLELWLELGATGALIALAVTLLALARATSLPPHTRPYALAAITAALTISLSNFEITTDSWWAALAATTLLLRTSADLEAL